MIRLPRRLFVLLCCGVALAFGPGCEARRTAEEPTLSTGDHDFICTLGVDLSGSFRHQMAEDGKAYQFLMAVLKRYFDNQSSSGNKLILVQLSGTERSLLWEGTPLELRRDFPTADAFREFLLNHADPNGSMIHDGVRNAIDYVATEPRVANGQARSAFFVLSDFLDNAPNPEQSEQKLVQSLTTYGKQGNIVGFYYVDQTYVPKWRRHLRDAGVREFCVEADFHGNPPFPNFER